MEAQQKHMKTQEKYLNKEGERETLRTGATFWAATVTLLLSFARILGQTCNSVNSISPQKQSQR